MEYNDYELLSVHFEFKNIEEARQLSTLSYKGLTEKYNFISIKHRFHKIQYSTSSNENFEKFKKKFYNFALDTSL